MMHTRKLLVAAVALIALGLPTLALAQVSGPAEAGGDLKSLNERVGKLEKTVNERMLEAFGRVGDDMKALNKQISDLQTSINAMQGKNLAINIDNATMNARLESLEIQLKALKTTIGQLEQSIARMQPPSTNITKSSPVPTAGRVKLENRYAEDMVFFINQKSYTVRAFSTQTVEEVPAGAMTYEVYSPTWGRRAYSSTTLSPGETLKLTAQ